MAQRGPRTSFLERTFISRKFANLWMVVSAASIAEFLVESVSMVWVVQTFGANSREAALGLGLLTILSTIPRLTVGPLAGVLSDRWSFRDVLLSANSGRVLALSLLMVAASIMRDNPGVILIVLLIVITVLTSLAQFIFPARFIAVRDIVKEADRPKASSLTMFSLTSLAVVATAIGPILYEGAGLVAVVGAATVAFLLASFGSYMLPRREAKRPAFQRTPKKSVWIELVEGWRISWLLMELRLVMLGVASYGIVLGANNVLLPLLTMGTLGLTPSLYGLAMAAFAAGTMIGSLCAAPVIRRWGDLATFPVALVGVALSYLALSVTRSFVAASVCLLSAGIFFAIFSVAQGPLLQRLAPQEMLGRVSATISPLLGVTSLAGAGVVSVGIGLAGANPSLVNEVYRGGMAAGAAILLIASCLISISVIRRSTREVS